MGYHVPPCPAIQIIIIYNSPHTLFFSVHMYLLTRIPSDKNASSFFSYLK
jgi:hypothetical protein